MNPHFTLSLERGRFSVSISNLTGEESEEEVAAMEVSLRRALESMGEPNNAKSKQVASIECVDYEGFTRHIRLHAETIVVNAKSVMGLMAYLNHRLYQLHEEAKAKTQATPAESENPSIVFLKSQGIPLP